MALARLGEVTLYYERHGDPDAVPLLLLHGALESFRTSWQVQIGSLATRFRLIGPDLRGHGRSTNPSGRMDLREIADELAALLDQIGIDRTHVCGYSGGGSAALFLALRHPDRLRRLVLISNNVEQDRARAAADFWSATRIRRDQPSWWRRLNRLHADVPALLNGWQQEDRVRPDFQPGELDGVTMPTLVVGGDRDPVVPLEQTIRLYQMLPNARLGILPGAGHAIPTHHAGSLDRLIVEFLMEEV